MDYRDIKTALIGLFEGEKNFIANAANFSSLIYNNMDGLNWCGFYFMNGDSLVLGPFCGKPACIRIPLGEGVCGTAAKERQTVVVKDVHEFPGHIACDPDSRSEIVVPMISGDKVFGVLDIDSPVNSRFGDNDKTAFKELVEILINASDVETLMKYYT